MPRQIVRKKLPLVAIVGRPNVGKSTMFNRLTGSRKAVVHEKPGMTRDLNYLEAEWEGKSFILIDTGGYELETENEIYRQMREQTLIAVDQADVIIFLTNLNEPNNAVDDEVMRRLRRSGKPVVLAINKADSKARREEAIAEFAGYGSKYMVGVSALHGNGTGDLLDMVVELLPDMSDDDEEQDLGIRLAVVGRPNVGKSTLVNKILGYERSIASDIPGTTRDAVDTTFERNEQRYTIIDTAGIRRRGKIEKGPEKLSALASRMSMQQCDVALLLVDAIDGITEQDAHVAGFAVDAGCAVIIVVNKWDAVEKTHRSVDEFTRDLKDEWGFLKDAPVLFISALTGQRVEKLFDLIAQVFSEYTREIGTSELNVWLAQATTYLSPPVRSGRQLKIKYVTQTGNRPPSFTFFVNDPDLVHFSYERFLLNQLRKKFGFTGVPVRFRYRQKSEDAPRKGRPYQR